MEIYGSKNGNQILAIACPDNRGTCCKPDGGCGYYHSHVGMGDLVVIRCGFDAGETKTAMPMFTLSADGSYVPVL